MQDGPDSRRGAVGLGLIAGAGHLPAEACRVLGGEGSGLRVYGFAGITDSQLGGRDRRTKLGQLTRLVDLLRKDGRTRLLLVGKFSKRLLWGAADHFDPDPAALELLSHVADWQDEGLMGAIAQWLEDQGFEILCQDEVLADLIAEAGVLTSRAPDDLERGDAAVGWRAVQALGRAGVGQAVAVRRGAVLALEAIEGTDAMIRRAGEFGGDGATIVKAARPGQDRRFDLPAIGPGTVDAMRAAGAGALAVEAGSTLVLDGATMRAAADAAGISIWAFEPDGEESR